MSQAASFILASASPRRRELLASAGLGFEIAPSLTDETPREDERPAAYVRRVAAAKARTVAAQARARADLRPVLAADTVVVLDGAILGKPADPVDAERMLSILSGRLHQVITGYCIIGPDGSERSDEVLTEVQFKEIRPDELASYLATGEWRDKAGAYAIQGRAAQLVRAITGSYTNVVGLPLCEVADALHALGED